MKCGFGALSFAACAPEKDMSARRPERAIFTAVAPGVDQPAVLINADDFAVVRAFAALDATGDELHVGDVKGKGRFLFGLAGQNGDAQRARSDERRGGKEC